VTLHTEFERLELTTETPFTIARGTTSTTENVVVRISDGDREGIGAAAPSAHYGETGGTVAAVLPDLLAAVEEFDDPLELAAIEARMHTVVERNPAARAAVSTALHDLVCKRLDVPLARYWGLSPSEAVDSSFTIGIDEPDRMAEKAESAVAAGYGVLKVKVGTDADRERVEAVRSAAPDARIRVDANEAWTPKAAVHNCEWLADLGVEFVEQPVPASDRRGLAHVHEHAPLPIAVDESCLVASDVPDVADRADVVVLKLMKCGGLRAARDLIATAHAHDLEVMLGCMLETSVSIAAAAHLAPAVEYADLDGSLLLADDPYDGPVEEGGSVELSDRPGLGVRR